MAFSLKSSAFEHGAFIPALYTCDDADISPPLSWSGAPEGTRSFALILDDPDAPDPKAPKRVFVHWVLFNIPPSVGALAEGSTRNNLPLGVREGRNDAGSLGYSGPCPPVGEHRYFFKLYALDTELRELDSPAKADVEAAIEGHVLAAAELLGLYGR